MLRRQLLAWLLVPLSVLLFVDTFVSYRVALEFARRAYDRSLVEIARDLSLHVRQANGTATLDLPPEARRILLEDPDDRVFHSVVDAGGRSVSGEGVLPAPPAAAHADGNESFYDAAVNGRPVRVVELRMPAPRAGVPHGAIVRVAETLNRRNELAREILLSVILPQALLLAVAGIVVWVGVAHGLTPLERLRRAVAARSHLDWRPVATDDVPGEVRPLLQAIDELVARLDHAHTLQSRFISDAAHQLKTPVAALKANVELAMRETDAQRAAQALAAANAGLDRISRLISQLLSLARNEPDAAASISLAPVDLGALVLEAATEWVPAALERRIDLGFEAAAVPVTVRGDRARLRELLDNLIDNAVRYTPDDGRVTVRVDAHPPSVQIDDDGPRIPPEERQRVFERFHRLLGDAHGGSGLGLAIAREIARIHGAAITLRDDDDGTGNTFKVEFPPLP
jgi:two-component system sensor histidine kinase TctE